MYSIEQRKQKILRAVVIEYITDAEPIASDLLSRKYDFGVKSATIRNELAEMENMGLLEQPHTSSGRVPSDKGYRYFVDHLAQPLKISSQKKSEIQKSSHDTNILHVVLDHMVNTLSKMTQLLSAATIFPNLNIQVVHFHISLLTETSIILVMVLSNGHVENRFLHFSSTIQADTLNSFNEYFKKNIQGKNIFEVQNLEIKNISPHLLPYLDKFTKPLNQILQEVLGRFIVLKGEEFLFAQPETTKNQNYISDLITSLSNPSLFTQALNQESTKKFKAWIGTENSSKHLFPFTLIKTNFYAGNIPVGTLALIGPTRLNYEFCIPILEFATQTITQNLSYYFKN